MSEEINTIIIEVSKVIDGEYTKRKRIVYVTSFDDLKRIAIAFTKGVILHYPKNENGREYDIFEVETKYAIYRLKTLFEYYGNELTEAQKEIKKALAEAVIQ